MTRPKLMPVLSRIALAVMTIHAGSAFAVGLGTIHVQSGLGQPLQLSIPLIGNDSAELLSSCIKSRIESSDGVYIGTPAVNIIRGQGQASLLLSTRQPVYEPALSVSIDLACGSLVHRDFQILMDPATSAAAASEPAGTTISGKGSRRSQAVGADPIATVPLSSRVDNRKAATAFAAPGLRRTEKLAPIMAATGPARNVLKLSSDNLSHEDMLVLGRMKLTNELAEAGPAATPAQGQEIISAQRRYAMLLRGEDPNLNAEQALTAQQAQVTRLKQQAAQAGVQRAAAQAALDDLRENSLSFGWAAGLIAVLLASLGAAGWLGWRLVALRKKNPVTPWDLSLLRSQTEFSSATAEAALDAAPATTTDLFSTGKKPATGLASVPEFLRTNEPVQAGFADEAAPAPEVAGVTKATADVAANLEALQFYPARVEHLKVEEISDVMQEAEFWVSLNDPARAIEILEPYGNLELPESPMPWLYLLDLYRAAGDQANYEALRGRTLRLFNARIPLWDEIPENKPPSNLENFPHVIAQICQMWETDQIVPYLESLILDNRDGARRGFDIEVYQEIMLLITIARGFGTSRYANPFGAKQQLALE